MLVVGKLRVGRLYDIGWIRAWCDDQRNLYAFFAILRHADRGKAVSETLINDQVKRGRATPAEQDALLGRITPTAAEPLLGVLATRPDEDF